MLFLSFARLGHAQDFAAAGQHFAAAQEAFAQAQYKRAAQEYQAAFDITKDPALLLNIGESWQRGDEPAKALLAYRAYLKEQSAEPSADRSEIESRIKTLEAATSATSATAKAAPDGAPAAAAAEKAVPPEAKTAPPETKTVPAPAAPDAVAAKPSVPGSSRLRTAAWISVAVAVALATAGAIMGLGAQNRADELQRRTSLTVNNQPPIYDENQRDAYQTLMDEGHAYNAASIGLLSVAGAAAVTGAALFVVDYVKQAKAEKSRLATVARPTLSIAGSSISLGVGGSF